MGHYTQVHDSIMAGIRETMGLIRGAYSVVLTTEVAVYAFRDPYGVRPLVLGKLDGVGYAVASETCGLDIMGAEYVRDIKPGEMIKISDKGLRSEQAVPPRKSSLCMFELIYFARPDSVLYDCVLYETRRKMGEALVREAPVDADMVMGVPDSGIPAAIGFAQASGIPYGEGLLKNRYVGRTFIMPEARSQVTDIKLNVVRPVVQGKRTVVIDDSIVRGTTSRKIIKMIRAAGAREVHVRISSPPTDYPCYYGIDTPTRKELIASSHTVDDIRKYITADSLGYISTDGLKEVIGGQDCFCDACFTGRYPISFPAIEQIQQPALF